MSGCLHVGLRAYPESPVPRQGTSLFLAVDLTTAVCDELLARDDVRVAIIYHPTIFSAVKSLTLANPLQRSVLRLVAAGVHLYCPHTALDVIDGGTNDWIAVGLLHDWEKEALSDEALYEVVRKGTGCPPCEPVKHARTPTEGMGRIVTLPTPCTLRALISRAKSHFQVDTLQLAAAPGVDLDTDVTRLAVCAGSGGSVVRHCADADVWVTGEMGHHELLAANAQGVTVLLANHSNTERRYFRTLFAPLLREQLECTVHVSEADCDPLRAV